LCAKRQACGNGRSRTADFLAIVDAVRALPLDQFVLDGEAVAHCPQGLPDFNRTLTSEGQRQACLYAFDVLIVAGEDLRPMPAAGSSQAASAAAPEVLIFSEHVAADGEAIFRHACAMGLDGIVSKRLASRYVSGSCRSWLKVKNPDYQRR
jgi:bifunctional non-homologous end joining protein LigD